MAAVVRSKVTRSAIESATTMHLIHDDDETESPFDLIREVVTIVGWVATTFALLLVAYAALG